MDKNTKIRANKILKKLRIDFPGHTFDIEPELPFFFMIDGVRTSIKWLMECRSYPKWMFWKKYDDLGLFYTKLLSTFDKDAVLYMELVSEVKKLLEKRENDVLPPQ